MKRVQLFSLFEKHKKKPDKERKETMRRELIEYLKSPEGQEALKKAPRVTVEFEPNFPLQEQPVERIADLILREFD